MLQAGFDIGGTNIAAGIVDEDANLVLKRSIPFPAGEPYQVAVEALAQLLTEMTEELFVPVSSLASIGIAVPGSIDQASERVVHAYNLQFHDVPLRSALMGYFPSVPVFLANDANAAALAELYAGAFVGCKTAVLITLGTGIGGGLILGGRMFNGGLGNGVELGHMVLEHGGQVCTCGTRGCIEALCTATWLMQQGRKSLIEYPHAMIATKAGQVLSNINAKLVIDCAKAGDAIAKDIFDRYVDQLGSALTSCFNLLDPEVIALGGGVSLAGEFLFSPLRENVKQKCFFKNCGKIVQAKLGNDAGIIGAAMLAKN